MINIPNNEIWYSSTDGNIISPSPTSFGTGVTIVSNSYTNMGVITFSSNITTVGNSAFVTQQRLNSIILPSTVTSIGDSAFAGDTSLISMTMLSTTPPSIGSSAFSNTRNDFSIYVPYISLDVYRSSSYWSNRYDYIFPIADDRQVKFYSLNAIPQTYQNGSFLNLTIGTANNPAGLYFCYNNSWKYLVNLNDEVRSAAIYGNTIYFYNNAPAPILTSVPVVGTYLFSIELPTLTSGAGISVSNGSANLSLSQTTVTGNTTTPHVGSTNLLKIDSNSELSISDTWDCGEYDNQVYRHVQQLKTSNVSYVHVLKSEIPDGTTITSVGSVPSNPTTSSPEYIQLSSGNRWYYRLSGRQPALQSIQYGEIAVSYADGFERLFIKNSNDEIIEFEPANRRRNIVSNATFLNDALTCSNQECVWYIPYSDITSLGISIAGAVVFLRENDTGKQLIPDVVFDGTNNRVVITIFSTTNIAANKYTAIVIGSNYNNLI